MRRTPHILFFGILVVLAALAVLGSEFFRAGTKQGAGLFFIESTTTTELKSAYRNAVAGEKKVKVLIVPGHDAHASGSAYRTVSEHDLTLEIGAYLSEFLARDDAFEVILAQTREDYHPAIRDYITKNRDAILAFRHEQKILMDSVVGAGLVDIRRGIEHNRAPDETMVTLYGINKWANENDVSVVLHLHFNDDPTRARGVPGKYTGFALYVPEKQYSNARASRALAETIRTRIGERFASSDMPLEREGIIESQDLIAVGARNTLDPAGILIEYGYIYEPSVASGAVRPLALKELAYRTTLGIFDFFGGSRPRITPSLFPYEFTRDVGSGTKGSSDVFMLQASLAESGFYPPAGVPLGECPLSGNFFSCTERALKEFQKHYSVIPASGFLGPKTRVELNKLYGE